MRGYVISTLPKLKEMSEGLQFDLKTKFGPLSALELKLRCSKSFVFGADPQTGSSIRKFFSFDFVRPCQMSDTAKKLSLYRA